MVRTRNESLQHILNELEAGRLGAMKGINCAYENDEGNHCAVGCLFTPAFHDEIKRSGLTHASLELLKQELQPLFTEATVGLNSNELKRMQSLHDDWAITKSAYTIARHISMSDRVESTRSELVDYINSLKAKLP